MIYVLVSTFEPPVKLREILHQSGKKYEQIVIQPKDETSESSNADEIISTLVDVFTVPSMVVEYALLKPDVDIIYVKNDGTLDDEVVGQLITNYYTIFSSTIKNAGSVIKVPAVKVVTMKNKLALLSILSSLESDQYQTNTNVREEETSIEEGETELESILGKNVESELTSEDDYELEVEQLESEEENVQLYKISLVDEDGKPVKNKEVKLVIESDDGVFSNTGTTETKVKLNEKGYAIVKVLVVDESSDVDFSFEVL